MQFSEMLDYILYIVLTAILPVTVKFAVDLVKAKIRESSIIEEATKNEIISNLMLWTQYYM